MTNFRRIIVLLVLVINFLIVSPFVYERSRFTRSGVALFYQDTKDASVKPTNGILPKFDDVDAISWLHRHSKKFGNASDFDMKVVLSSLRHVAQLESAKYPRIKVYNYDFGEGDVRELLIYYDPDEEKQWILNIEEVDMRQNLIVFPLGDLGFGFRKEETLVVLRKSKSRKDPFHYVHLAYVQSKTAKGKSIKNIKVEWDNIRANTILPIPLSFHEDFPENQCFPRKCSIIELIYGTCPIVKLSCAVLQDLPISKLDKERVHALIREQQPFIYELAKTLTINKSYLEIERRTAANSNSYRAKRGSQLDIYNHFGEDDDFHHAIKKDHAEGFADGPTSLLSKRTPEEEEPSNDDEATSANPEEHKDSGETSITEDSKEAVTTTGSVGKGEEDPPANEKPKGVNVSAVTNSNTEIKAKDQGRKQDTSSNQRSNGFETSASYNRMSSAPYEHIPSSFDLLMVKNASHQSPDNVPELENPPPEIYVLPKPLSGTDNPADNENTHFATIIDKIRNGPPGKYTVRPLECVGCEKIGTFLSDFDETILNTYVANNIIANIFRNSSYRKNLFTPNPHDFLSRHSNIPFLGYGHCYYTDEVLGKPPISTEIDDVVVYYAESLGGNCHKKDCEGQQTRNKLREMMTSKLHLLEIWPDISVRFNRSSNIAKNLILSTSEFQQFMTALIFSAYTTEYRMHAVHHADKHYNNPNLVNQHQSERMKFLTRLTLRVIEDLVKQYPLHLIKGLRFLLQIIQDKYLSLVAESIGISEYPYESFNRNESIYKIINRNDRIQTIALRDFIINGVAAVAKSDSGTFPAFITFFNRNFKRILHSFVEYGIERVPMIKGGHNQPRSVVDRELDLVFRRLSEASHAEEEDEIQEEILLEEEEGERRPVIKKRFVKITRYE